MGKVRDAVIVAAGLGTRMLPTSAYIPKELLPLVDVPVLHHLIFEAKASRVRSNPYHHFTNERFHATSRKFNQNIPNVCKETIASSST